MTTPMETHGSKGMAMVASYRAARLSGRAALRDSLRRAETARPPAGPGLRPGVPGASAAAGAPTADASPAAARPETGLPPAAAGSASIFAGLISLSITGRDGAPPPEAAALQPQAAPAVAPDVPAPEVFAPDVSAPDVREPERPAAELPELAVAPEPEPELPAAALPAPDLAAVAAAGLPVASAPIPAPIPAPGPAEPPAGAAAASQPAPEQSLPPPVEPLTAPHRELPDDPPLAEIGFGPGMLIRLSQIGLHTVGDLAQADVAQLRSALGDISRLVDVGTWINSARQSVAAHRQ